MRDEENISTKQQTAKEEARLSCQDEDEGRTEGDHRPSSQGPSAPFGLRGRGLPRHARLRRRSQFRQVYDDGVRFPGRHLVLFALCRPSGSGGASRLGVTASRRVGGAVARSRSRRRLRELFRLHFEEPSRGPVDVVLNARVSCGKVAWSTLKQDFERCLRALHSRLARSGERSGRTSAGSPPSSLQPVASTQRARSTPRRPWRGTGSGGGDGSV